MTTTVRTKRLILRQPTGGDADGILQLYSDERTSALSPVPRFTSLAEAVRAVTAWGEHWAAFGYGPWRIALLEAPGEILGVGGITNRDFDGQSCPNLWYRLTPNAWGQGYATEFAFAAVKQLISTTSVAEVHALVLESNLASVRVLEKLGMHKHGSINNKDSFDSSIRYKRSLNRPDSQTLRPRDVPQSGRPDVQH